MAYKIVVIGGGTAGVMAATYFKSYWGNLVDVSMIYDHRNPGIGVGESLTPLFDSYLKTVGVSTVELIQNCHATIKLGLKFTNWTTPGSEWTHSFPMNEALACVNPTLLEFNAIDAYDILHNRYNNAYNYDDYYFKNNLIVDYDNLSYRHALHVDANLVGRYIESKFKDKINIVDGIVKTVNVKDNNIESAVLNTGEVITADLFIDASGMECVLFKHLNPTWVDVSDQLPTNRTIPNPLFKDFDYIPPYTHAAATKNGWILDVPLSNRRGTGYVYCSDFTSDEEAKRDFDQWLTKTHNVGLQSDRVIKFSNGYWKEQWIGNCVCMGMASGFIEPLEATSIHNTVSQLEKIAALNYLDNNNTFSQKTYNEFTQHMYETAFKYIRFFYHTKRNDSEFWKYLTNNVPAWVTDIEEKIQHSFITAFDLNHRGVMFDSTSFLSVAYGHGYCTREGVAKLLTTKYLYNHAQHTADQILKIKNEMYKKSVDHKQWIDFVRSSR